ALLNGVSPERLEALVRDSDFLAHYDAVMEWFALERSNPGGWFRDAHPDVSQDHPVARFRAAFRLHNPVPVPSGGLGVLARDHGTPARDLRVPLVGVGLFYKRGYFVQRVRRDGWQEDGDHRIDPELTPLVPVASSDG